MYFRTLSRSGYGALIQTFTNKQMHYLESFSLCLLESLGDDPGVESLRDIPVGLLQQLSDNQHIGSGTIPRDVILCGGGGCKGVRVVEGVGVEG